MTGTLDNDVVFKAGCYGLLDEVRRYFDSSIAVLGTAQFVMPRKIRRAPLVRPADEVVALVSAFLDAADRLEPSDDEALLAAELEASAQAASVALDTGESLLCAIVASRSGLNLHTGDKRAIAAIEHLVDAVRALQALTGKVHCLEQLVFNLMKRHGDPVRVAICSEREIDRALNFALSCHRPEPDRDAAVEGLVSYIEDVRRTAPRMLAP